MGRSDCNHLDYSVEEICILEEGNGVRTVQDISSMLEEKKLVLAQETAGNAMRIAAVRTVVWSDMDDSEKIDAIKDIVGEEKTE